MKACIVIPYFNHGGAIGKVIAGLRPLGLPCRIVDDGSDPAEYEALMRAVADDGAWVSVQRLPENRGKGAAVRAGCEQVYADGFTHAVQIDADGQHRVEDVPKLLEIARRNPHALVSGQAVYDDSVPRARLYGRYITHVWVWINTLSLEIKDSMCGLRVYPLAATCEVWRTQYVGSRMDFDTEIMVRLSWRGVPVINVRISLMHARLLLGMLWRSPFILGRRLVRKLRAA
jgi:glycosyltransferase involved in cell wall biosynthesis